VISETRSRLVSDPRKRFTADRIGRSRPGRTDSSSMTMMIERPLSASTLVLKGAGGTSSIGGTASAIATVPCTTCCSDRTTRVRPSVRMVTSSGRKSVMDCPSGPRT
jgi:hypothetical protein